jgi:O-antigen ligase
VSTAASAHGSIEAALSLSTPSRLSVGGLVLAAALPFLFLHDKYQPFTIGSGRVEVRPADLAMVAVAVFTVRSFRWSRLRGGLVVWAPLVAFLVYSGLACFYPLLREPGYDWATYLITAVKFAEYAVLAPAVVLLVRGRRDLDVLLGALVLWSTAMTTVGVLQFLGLVDELEGRRPGQREPSYVGIHDFAALSTAALVVGIVAIAFGTEDRRERAFGLVASVSGAIGLILSGSVAAAGGLAVVAVAVLVLAGRAGLLTGRRVAGVAAITAVSCLGVLVLRGSDLDQFARFLGIRQPERSTVTQVQSYSQRTLLIYIGGRIWLDHPIFGAGYQASAKDPKVFEPYLPDAHRKFPDTAAEAFPSAAQPWGVQSFYVQALADLGVVGLVLWLAIFAAALWVALRARASAAGAVAIGWLLVAAAVWTARGILAGLPLDALTWLAVGLVVWAAEDARG